MRKQKKFTQQKKFIPRAVRPNDARAKERMADALAAYQGPITKCPPGGSAQKRTLSASTNVAKGPSRPPK
jgi:hypothetical protein